MSRRSSTNPTALPHRPAKPIGTGVGVSGGDETSTPGSQTVQPPATIAEASALKAVSSSVTPIVVNLVLPPVPAGCRAVVRITDGGFEVTIEHARLGYSLEEACQIIPNAPHPDTLRSHLEKNGIAIGQCGRAPLISYEQLFAALRLSA